MLTRRLSRTRAHKASGRPGEPVSRQGPAGQTAGRFFLTVLGVWVAGNLYLGYGLIEVPRPSPHARLEGWAVLMAFAVLVPAVMFLHRRPRKPEAWVLGLMWPAYLWMSFVALAFPALLLRDILWAGTRLAEAAAGPFLGDDASRLLLLRRSGFLVLALAGLGLVVGFAQAKLPPRFRRTTVPLDGLPEGLDGLVIAHVSDLHLGGTRSGRELARLVGRLNAEKLDLVALTGDVADGRAGHMRATVAPLADLNPPLGVLFVSGNHEYYWDHRGWMEALPGLGLRVLDNTHAVIKRGGAVLLVAGVPDPNAGTGMGGRPPDLPSALRGAPEADLKILLSHQPVDVSEAGDAGFSLMLSGHTHGGQFWPWRHVVAAVQPLMEGLHRRGRLWVHVSRGTGYWGPPNRLFVPPEVTLLTLRKT
jgi:predicted MPP superfamily phosphohydrolase